MMLKKYSDFGGGKKKKSDSEFLSYNIMLNSGGKRYSNSRVVRKKILNKKKTIAPPHTSSS